MGIQEALIEKQKGRIVELEQQVQAMQAGLAQEHVDTFLRVLDGLMLVVKQAERGDPAMRAPLQNFTQCIERARAASSNIALPTAPVIPLPIKA